MRGRKAGMACAAPIALNPSPSVCPDLFCCVVFASNTSHFPSPFARNLALENAGALRPLQMAAVERINGNRNGAAFA